MDQARRTEVRGATGVRTDTYHPVVTFGDRVVRHRFAEPNHPSVTTTVCGTKTNMVAHVLSTVLDRATYCPGCFPGEDE